MRRSTCCQRPGAAGWQTTLVATVVAVSALAERAFASSQQDANRFVDELLGQHLVAEAGRFQLASVPLDDFKFKIRKELELGIVPTHRDIKANFTNGALVGLTTQLRRKGNCNPTAFVQGSLLLTCPIDLSGVEAKYTSYVKGFNIVGQVKEIEVKVKIIDTMINFEVQELPENSPSVKTFQIDKLRTLVEMPDVGFNEDRQSRFREEVEKEVHPKMFVVLTGKLLEAVGAALKRPGVKLPPV